MLSTKHCDFRVAEFYSKTVLLQFRLEPHVLEYHIQIIGYNKANSVLLDLVENVKLIWTVLCCTQFFMGNKLKFTSFILSMWVCLCSRKTLLLFNLVGLEQWEVLVFRVVSLSLSSFPPSLVHHPHVFLNLYLSIYLFINQIYFNLV